MVGAGVVCPTDVVLSHDFWVVVIGKMAGVKDGSVIVNIIYWSLCGSKYSAVLLYKYIYPKAQVEGAVIIL